MRARHRAGRDAERLAHRHLRRAGLEFVASNYRCRRGEIDIVMRRGGTLVIVEVRYRGPGSRLAATETITYRKRQRLLRATEHFLARHRRYAGMAVRFDVVGIDRDPAGKTRLQWIRDAFRPGD